MPITDEKLERWSAAQDKEDEFWRRGGVFAPQMERVLSRYKPVIDELTKEVPEDGAILDVGSGPTCTGRLFDAKTKVFLDPLMDSYREIHKETLPTDGELLTARAEEIPKPDETFDAVISVNAVDHMIDPDSVLQEVRRVMKKDAFFVLGLFLHPAPIAVVRGFVEKVLPFLREDAHPYSFTRSSARALCERHFRVEREIAVHRKDKAMFPSLHREDRLYICRKS